MREKDGRLKAGRLGWFIGGRRMLWVKSVRSRTEEQTSWLNSEVSEVCARFGSPFVLVPQSVSGLSMCRDLQVSDKTDLSDVKKKRTYATG